MKTAENERANEQAAAPQLKRTRINLQELPLVEKFSSSSPSKFQRMKINHKNAKISLKIEQALKAGQNDPELFAPANEL